MVQISNNLKQARQLINMTQKECEDFCGVNQKEISLLESDKREFIPNEYLFFLNEKGVDLNTIFKYNSEVALKEANNNIMNEPSATYGLSKEDKYIAFLEQTMESLQADKTSLQRTIDQLQEQLKYMRS